MRTELPSKDHSYEEIRAAALDVLSGRETKFPYEPDQYGNLAVAVAEVFLRREASDAAAKVPRDAARLTANDSELFMEVFWDLFRENIITLGLNTSNNEFPFFRVSHAGKKILANQQVYFFHDVSTYEALILTQAPNIDVTTLLYLKEAMQSFRSGCILSATVMLGVAAEHTFLRLLEAIDSNAKHKATYAAVEKERSILPKINKFRDILNTNLSTVPKDVKEDLDTRVNGIQSLIREFRNDSGHPTGKIVDREQAYVLLNLFVPYAKKMYQLIDYFGQP